VAHGFQDVDRIGIEIWLNPQLIAGALIDSRLMGGLFNIEVEIDDVDDHLHDRIDDRAPPGRSGDEPRISIFMTIVGIIVEIIRLAGAIALGGDGKPSRSALAACACEKLFI